jgi:hypothetical protein
MEEIWPDLTPVRHKSEGYTGWIDGVTRMKELFTGNKECLWQYRVKVAGESSRRVVGSDALERIEHNGVFPDEGFSGGVVLDGGFQQETRLHFLGYNITDKSHDDRWSVIFYTAVPILGLKAVLRTIMMLAERRMSSAKMLQRNYYALLEWKKDLERIRLEYAADPLLKETWVVNGLNKIFLDFEKNKI